jgi:hypothetical protein
MTRESPVPGPLGWPLIGGPRNRPTGAGFWHWVRTGLVYYELTSSIVVLGVFLAHDFVIPPGEPRPEGESLLRSFVRWDGFWYEKILMQGYSYDPHQASDVAFFPAYPLLGRSLVHLTGWSPDLALLMVAHGCLAGTFILLAAYAAHRFKDSPREFGPYVLLAFGLLPTNLCFRMAYTESLFTLLTVLVLFGMERRWPLILLALITGLATATRPVGVGLLPPLILHAWHRSATGARFLGQLLYLVPAACWGLGAYMAFQYLEFGEPWAFALTQTHWQMGLPAPPGDRVIALETLAPLWSVFDPRSLCYWTHFRVPTCWLFSPLFVDRFFFLLAVVLTGIGTWKRWLSMSEVALAVSLLVIPYVTRAHEMCMASMGRFASAAFPVYLVLGVLLTRAPAPLAAAVLALSGFLLGVYAALFAAEYRFF